MKLKNKKTGEIVRVEFLNNYQTDDGAEIGFRVADTLVVYSYNSLADLNAEWEDAPEEPKKYWYIDCRPKIATYHTIDTGSGYDERQKEIGNYFETKEKDERAVEKLKAWKRLKDKGFEFIGDLDLLFGDEE